LEVLIGVYRMRTQNSREFQQGAKTVDVVRLKCGPRPGGMTGTHFHDLRHTGNALTAATGATLRELMDRMGHSSPRAALFYLHGSRR